MNRIDPLWTGAVFDFMGRAVVAATGAAILLLVAYTYPFAPLALLWVPLGVWALWLGVTGR